MQSHEKSGTLFGRAVVFGYGWIEGGFGKFVVGLNLGPWTLGCFAAKCDGGWVVRRDVAIEKGVEGFFFFRF